MLAVTSAMVAESVPLGWDRVRVSVYLGATGLPVVTSLHLTSVHCKKVHYPPSTKYCNSVYKT